MSKVGLGNFIARQGEKMVRKGLESQYGKQIGKTAKNGQMAFRQSLGLTEDGLEKTITTGCDRRGNVIAVVERRFDSSGNGITKKIVYDEAGNPVKAYNSRIATNFYDNRSYDLNTGHITQKTSAPSPTTLDIK